VHLAFDIFAGLGIAAAVGIRPFLPALVVGALAAASVAIHFKGTDYSFLQSAPFLLAVGVVGVLEVARELRYGAPADERDPAAVLLVAAGVALAALFFAASLARGHYASWPGLIAGAGCAVVAVAATRPLFARVRDRLDVQTAKALPLYVEVIAIVLAALSVFAPPVGLIGLLGLGWLLVASRRRVGQKYAGLRILR
jgi:hypothetical protein